MTRKPKSTRRALAWVLLVSGLALLGVEALAFCLLGTSVYDEGGYLYEGWMVVAHGWMPFHDFYTKVPPLLYYLYGVGQAVAGPSFLLGRVQAVGFALLGLGIAMWLARRLAGRWAALLVLWMFVLCLPALNNYFHAYAVAPTGMFIILAGALLVGVRPGLWGACLGSLATAGILLCRHDLLPLAVALWAYLAFWYPVPARWRWGALALGIGAFALVLLPFYLAAPLNVVAALTTRVPASLGHFPTLYGTAAVPSPFAIVWHTMIFVRYYGACLVLLIPAWAWWRGRRTETPTLPATPLVREPWQTAMAVLLLASAGNWLGRLILAVGLGKNISYLLDLYIYWPVAVASAVLFVQCVRSLRDRLSAQGHLATRLALAWAGLALVLVPVLTGPGPLFRLSRARPTAVEQVRRGGAFIRQHTTPQDVIFTLDDPHQFLEAGRVIPAPLTHELFSYRESPDTAALDKLFYFNQERIGQWLNGEATVVVTSARREQWMAHSGRNPRGPELHEFVSGLIARNYQLVAEAEGTYDGPTRIYHWRGRSER